jgi:hypothetical protein
MNNQMQDAPLEFYHAKYYDIDPEKTVKRTGLTFDTENSRFVLTVLSHTLYAAWPNFELVPAEPERCPKILYGFSMQILTIRFLIAGAAARTSGSFKAYRELPWGELYDANFQGRCIARLAYGFGYKLDKFEKAAQALGGVEADIGDKAFDLPFLGGVVCRFILWAPDDEFPPSSQILFSDNTQVAFNAEDLAGVGDVVISALKEISR